MPFINLYSILLISLVYCSTSNIQAQKPEFEIEKYGSREGLSHNQVFGCTKDSDGFMWFGTSNGLNCFDGYHFKTFFYKKDDSLSAPSNTVVYLYTNKAQNLVLGSSNGVHVYDKKRKTFMPFFSKNIQSQNPDVPFNAGIWKITEDTKGNYWFFTMSSGFYVWHPKQSKIAYFHKNAPNSYQKIPDNMVRDMQEDSEGNYWICNRTALIKLSGNPFSPDFTPDYAIGSADDFIIDALLLDDGGLLVGNFNGGLHYVSKTMQKNQQWRTIIFDKSKDLLPKVIVRCLYLDSQKRVWVGTRGDGLFLFKNAPTSFKNPTQFTDNLNEYTTISHNFVTSLYEDDQHILWVLTDGNGFNKLDEHKYKFASYNRQHKPPYYFPAKTPIGYAEDKTNLYFGTFLDGLIIKNKKTGVVTQYKEVGTPTLPIHKYSIRHVMIDSLKNNIWLTANGMGLIQFNPISKTFNQMIPPSDSAFLNLKRIGGACLDKNNNLILGSNPSSNFFVYSIKTNLWRAIPFDTVQHRELEVYGVACDQKGDIWIGTDGGLFVFDINFQRKAYFDKAFLSKNGFYNQINTIFVNGQNDVWIGSTNGVIGKWLPMESRFDTLLIEKDRFITAINQNQQLYELWVSTTNGLYRLDLRYKKIYRYDREDGLQENEFNRNSTFRDGEGNLIFGGINGYSIVPITTIEKNNYAPKPVFTDISVFNKSFSTPYNLNHSPSLQLSYKENFFTLFFSMLNFSNTTKNKYEYQLEGFDKNWVNGNMDNFAHYTNVPPGTYKFRLKAKNNDTVAASDEAVLTIVITPPFWQTWWFRLFLLSLLAYGIHYFYQFRKKQIEEKQALKQHALETEMKALRAQMNPHFIFNTLNSINNYIAKEEPDMARSYLTGFAKLMRNILELSREESISLANELETVKNFITLERIRFRERFSYHLTIAPDVNTNSIKILPLILQPFVENAIWHGLLPKKEGGNIWIRVNTEGGKLIITIEDDGVGRSKKSDIQSENYRKSYGSTISEERLKLQNLLNNIEIIDKFDEAHKPCGTSVILTFIQKN
jgi:ligand-binding sensor domain-containing protein/two-component sensor histidine kinase